MIDHTGRYAAPRFNAIRAKLRDQGLRPTRQRLDLGYILFAQGNRHVNAEQLHGEAATAGVRVSLATVYNTLRQFTEAGLLREVRVDGSRSFFDTNTGDHHHFFIEDEERVLDVPGATTLLETAPEPPEGYEVAGIDVVVRLRRIES